MGPQCEDGDIVWVKYGNLGKYLAAIVFDLSEVPKQYRDQLRIQINKEAKGHPENYCIVKFYSTDQFTTTHKNKIRIFGDRGNLTSSDKKKGKEDPKGFKLALKDFESGFPRAGSNDEEEEEDEVEEVESKKKKSKRKEKEEEEEEDSEEERRRKKKKNVEKKKNRKNKRKKNPKMNERKRRKRKNVKKKSRKKKRTLKMREGEKRKKRNVKKRIQKKNEGERRKK